MLSERGIEANSDKCRAITKMHSSTSVKEVQQLTGRIAALSRFMSKVGEKAHPFFQCIKKEKAFQWTDECEEAFQ
jgi:ribosome biogenesis protein Nip4